MIDVFIQHNCNKIVHVDWNQNINFVVHFFTLDKFFHTFSSLNMYH